MYAEYDANNPTCVECGVGFARAVRKQGGGTHKIYCTPKCRANSWARGNTEKRRVSVIKYDRKPESIEAKQTRARIGRFRKYGLTEEEGLSMLAKQHSQCSGCLIPLTIQSAQIDHCHSTGVVRGMLCTSCNWAIGHIKDNPETLFRLAEYLNEKIVLDRKSTK